MIVSIQQSPAMQFKFCCPVFLTIAFGLAVAIVAGQEPITPKTDGKPEFDAAHAEKMQDGLALFKSQVRKLLIDNCVECHGGGEVESGFDLATRKALVRGGAHGPAVVPGKSADSNVV